MTLGSLYSSTGHGALAVRLHYCHSLSRGSTVYKANHGRWHQCHASSNHPPNCAGEHVRPKYSFPQVPLHHTESAPLRFPQQTRKSLHDAEKEREKYVYRYCRSIEVQLKLSNLTRRDAFLRSCRKIKGGRDATNKQRCILARCHRSGTPRTVPPCTCTPGGGRWPRTPSPSHP
jgi:hypothetical protein